MYRLMIILLFVTLLQAMNPVHAFTFTDVVAKVQRAEEFMKTAERFGEWQGYAKDSLGYLQTSLQVYHNVNVALRTADWTDFVPQEIYYQNSDPYNPVDLQYSDLDGKEELAKLLDALDARGALSPDMRAFLEDEIKAVGVRAKEARKNLSLLNDMQVTMDNRLIRINNYASHLQSISVGTGEANQTALLAFLGSMMVEMSRQNQEIQMLLLFQVKEQFESAIATREYGVKVADLDRNAQQHNLQVMRELLAGKSQ